MIRWDWTGGKGPLNEWKPAATTWATLSNYQQDIVNMHYPTDNAHADGHKIHTQLVHTNMQVLTNTTNYSGYLCK